MHTVQVILCLVLRHPRAEPRAPRDQSATLRELKSLGDEILSFLVITWIPSSLYELE